MMSIELTAHHRCDVNRVEQARVVWAKPDVPGDFTGDPIDLMFCSHHSEKYGPELTAQGWIAVGDTRTDLTKRAVGAEVS